MMKSAWHLNISAVSLKRVTVCDATKSSAVLFFCLHHVWKILRGLNLFKKSKHKLHMCFMDKAINHMHI